MCPDPPSRSRPYRFWPDLLEFWRAAKKNIDIGSKTCFTEDQDELLGGDAMKDDWATNAAVEVMRFIAKYGEIDCITDKRREHIRSQVAQIIRRAAEREVQRVH